MSSPGPDDITPQATREDIVRRVQAVADVVRSHDLLAANLIPDGPAARLKRAMAMLREGVPSP